MRNKSCASPNTRSYTSFGYVYVYEIEDSHALLMLKIKFELKSNWAHGYSHQMKCAYMRWIFLSFFFSFNSFVILCFSFNKFFLLPTSIQCVRVCCSHFVTLLMIFTRTMLLLWYAMYSTVVCSLCTHCTHINNDRKMQVEKKASRK